MVQAIDVILAFFTDNGMVVELMVSTLLFTWWLERRDMFWWRALTRHRAEHHRVRIIDRVDR